MEPTVSITIDPHPDSTEPAPFESLAGAPKPYYIPPPPPPTPCDTQYDPAKILQVVGMSFGVGVVIGGVLVFAFSRPIVCDA